MTGRLHLYGHPASGNVYKPQLLMALLGIAHDHTPIKWNTSETRTPAFLRMNPAGRVPVLVEERPDGAFFLPESNAQLWYLAQGTSFWPDDIEDQAQVLRWLFWEQYSHEPYLAVVRNLLHEGPPGADTDRRIAERTPGAQAALDVLEGRLAGRDWLVGASCSIADLCLYAYTHVAEEAGFRLADYPAIQAWLQRVEAVPGFVPMAAYESALGS